MTVIAAFSVDTCPVVFGDLLVSGATEGSPPVSVPAVGAVQDYFENSGWSILGLKQKVVVISDYCVLAWAGSWLGARLAIADLRSLAVTTLLTADGVRA